MPHTVEHMPRHRTVLRLAIVLGLLGWSHAFRPGLAKAPADDVVDLVRAVKSVGREAQGNPAATKACRELSQLAPDQLPKLLSALDDADPLAANWLRACIDTVAERAVKQGAELPKAELERFVLDTSHAPKARRLAFDWLMAADAKAPDRLVPGMLDDPSLELRRDAVARLLDQAAGEQKAGRDAVAIYEQALHAARDLDQVKLASEELKRLGHAVDVAGHFGFIKAWKLIGPFDNSGKDKFDMAYPPEQPIDMAAEYEGKSGKLKWIEFETKDDYGNVDLNKALGQHKGAAAYAYAEFDAAGPRDAELRLGTVNGSKVWLNGKLLHRAEVYHALTSMDQYIARGRLLERRLAPVPRHGQQQRHRRPRFARQLEPDGELGLEGPTARPGSLEPDRHWRQGYRHGLERRAARPAARAVPGDNRRPAALASPILGNRPHDHAPHNGQRRSHAGQRW